MYVDNIESNVETAAVRVDKGNRQLETAVRHKVRTCTHMYIHACHVHDCVGGTGL